MQAWHNVHTPPDYPDKPASNHRIADYLVACKSLSLESTLVDSTLATYIGKSHYCAHSDHHYHRTHIMNRCAQ